MVSLRINPDTGLRVNDGGIVDYFFQEFIPPEDTGGTPVGVERPPEDPKSVLF